MICLLIIVIVLAQMLLYIQSVGYGLILKGDDFMARKTEEEFRLEIEALRKEQEEKGHTIGPSVIGGQTPDHLSEALLPYSSNSYQSGKRWQTSGYKS
jgi:hypothetical protein